jgi:hypothetical protein
MQHKWFREGHGFGACGKTPVSYQGMPSGIPQVAEIGLLYRLVKNSWRGPQSPSAAKAVAENTPLIAAVNRCATQKQEQNRVFQHSV